MTAHENTSSDCENVKFLYRTSWISLRFVPSDFGGFVGCFVERAFAGFVLEAYTTVASLREDLLAMR